MEIEKKEPAYAYWLSCIPGIGNRTIRAMLEKCGTPKEIYEGGEKLWRSVLPPAKADAVLQACRRIRPQEAYEELQKKQIRFVWPEHPEYPKRLRDIPDAPYALFVKGRLPDEEAVSVAVIGARDCSEYGKFVANGLGRLLGAYGVQVVSGMARGIDGISQRAALDAGGLSFGVLGSGVDVCYPKENRELYDRLCSQGGILSIYPPGTEAKPQNFPPRNRIVSGLADAVVVVEARSKSGTLITVDMALEQGKEVFAVPGRVTDRLSDGCNQLLKQGAGVFLTPEDFLQEIEALQVSRGGGEQRTSRRGAPEGVLELEVPRKLKKLEEPLQQLYRILDIRPKSLEEIRKEAQVDYPAARLTALLMRLCMEELAVQLTPGYFARKP